MNFLENHILDISKLCKIHKVKALYAFGSVLREDFNDKSDVDLVVDFKTLDVLDYADNYFDFKFSLEEIFKRTLFDILSSIEEIESYFSGSMQFQDYEADLRTKRAVERNIEIIGEAMNRILKVNDEIQITDSRKIVDVRNRIIHGYDSVSDAVIWGIVIKQVPVLKKEVEQMLSE